MDLPTSFPKLEFHLEGFTFIQLLKLTKTNLEMTLLSLFRRPGGWCSACVAALDSLNSEEVWMNCCETTQVTARLDDIVDFGLARNLDRVGGLRRWEKSPRGLSPSKVVCYLRHEFDNKVALPAHEVARNGAFPRFLEPRSSDQMSSNSGQSRNLQYLQKNCV